MRRATARALAALLAGATVLTGCSGGGSDRPAGDPSSSAATPSATPDPTATVATVGTVTGRLPAAQRTALAGAVTTVVDGWLDGAYLGDFPRADFAGAFAGFTPGAAAKARRDLALMSNAGLSGRIDGAEATRRAITLDVLAVGRRAVGVTATVALSFRTTGALATDQQVTGTLDLTPVGKAWKIFGYRISRTPARPAPAATTAAPTPAASSAAPSEDAS